MINVSGHRLGTAEVESALVENHKVAEAAVVGMPHDVKGQGIYAFVTLKAGESPTDALKEELKKFVSEHLSPIAKPDVIQFAPGLPKTRSGKIMRRILRKIAEGDTTNLGDTSTLADPGVVDDLVRHSKRGLAAAYFSGPAAVNGEQHGLPIGLNSVDFGKRAIGVKEVELPFGVAIDFRAVGFSP